MATGKKSAVAEMSEPLVMHDSPLITEEWGDMKGDIKLNVGTKTTNNDDGEPNAVKKDDDAVGPVTFTKLYWCCAFAGLRLSGSNFKMKCLSYFINVAQIVLIVYDVILVFKRFDKDKDSLQVQVAILLDLTMMILSIIFIHKFSKSSQIYINGSISVDNRNIHYSPMEGGGSSGDVVNIGSGGRGYNKFTNNLYHQSQLENWIDAGCPGWRNWMIYIAMFPVIGYLLKDAAADFLFDTMEYAAFQVLFVIISLTPVSTGLMICFICIAAPYASSFQHIVRDYGIHYSTSTSLSTSRVSLSLEQSGGLSSIYSTRGGGDTFGINDLQLFKDKLKQMNTQLKQDSKIPNHVFIIPMLFLRFTHSLFEMWIIFDISIGNYDDDFHYAAPTKVSLAYVGASFFFDLSYLVAFLLPILYTNYCVDQISCQLLDKYCCSEPIGSNLVSFIMWFKEAQIGWCILSFRPSSRVLKVVVSSSIIILGTLLTRILNN